MCVTELLVMIVGTSSKLMLLDLLSHFVNTESSYECVSFLPVRDGFAQSRDRF